MKNVITQRLIGTALILAMASVACSLGGSLPEPTAIAALPTETAFIAASPIVVSSTQAPAPSATVPTSAPAPNCTPRGDWPIYSVVAGDTLGSLAVRTASTVDILTAANCLANSNILAVGQQLRVPVVPATLPTPTSNTCPGNVSWFFTFTAGAIDRLCPNPVLVLNAVGEDFEGGRMLWYAAPPGGTDQRPTIYVIYNDGSWETFVDVWDASQPANDPSIVPPTGRFQPVNGFGKVWRENAYVRQTLNWAYEPESPFTGHMQTVIVPSPRPQGYIDHWYLDHGKAGIVLRLYSVDMAPNRWELAGKY